MKLLVIGASGQLARSLVERARLRPDLSLRTLARPRLDLADPASIAAIGAIEADVVINAAAYTAVDLAEAQPEMAFRINADAAGELAAAARRGGGRFGQVSTDYVFDGEATRAYTENAPTNPLNVYGRSKLAGEEAVRAECPEATVVRTAWVYSQYGQNFLHTMISLGAQRERVSVIDDQLGSPTAAADLADGLLTMVNCRRKAPELAGKTYHLAGTGATSWAGFAEQIFAECRKRGISAARVERISSKVWPSKALRPRNSTLDSSAFARNFNFTAPAWQSSVSTTLDKMV